MKSFSKLFLPCCLACVIFWLAGGCASYIKIRQYNEDWHKSHKTFQATTGDFNLMVGIPVLTPFWICDLPFSLATDIVMLPLDIYWDFTKEKRMARKKEEYEARKSDSNETSAPP